MSHTDDHTVLMLAGGRQYAISRTVIDHYTPRSNDVIFQINRKKIPIVPVGLLCQSIIVKPRKRSSDITFQSFRIYLNATL